MSDPLTETSNGHRIEILPLDEERTIKLAEIEQEVKALIMGDADANFQRIEAELQSIWEEAEGRGDDQTKARVEQIYDDAQSLATASSQLTGIAVGSRFAQVEAEERFDELVDDIEDVNHANPLVRELSKTVRETVEWGQALREMKDDQQVTYENVEYRCADLLGMNDEVVIVAFCRAMSTGYVGYGTSVIPDEVWREIGAFIEERLRRYG